MTSTTIDIVSITTGRASYLIGPTSAFGSGARDLVIRERPRILGILVQFVSQPGTVDQLRPHMRRWGLSHSHSMLDERERMRQALLNAIASGQLSISIAPDVTRGFSVPHAVIVSKATSAAKAQALMVQPHLPVDLDDRLIIVMQMVPDYMSGATKAAFVRTLEDVGVGMIVSGLMAWIGAHFIPGINIAILAFDLFFLSSDVIRACETIGAQIDAIRKAKNRQDLEPAARAIAGAIAIMLVKGVFNRLLRAKSVPKAAGKKTTHAIDEKPNMGKGRAPKREARKPALEGDRRSSDSTSHETRPTREVAQPAPHSPSVKQETEVVQRWMSRAELEVTQKTGLMRGGRDGTHYVTDSANADPKRARQRTALPQTPEVLVTMEVPKDVFSAPSKVAPANNMPGGGMERTAEGRVPVKILEVK